MVRQAHHERKDPFALSLSKGDYHGLGNSGLKFFHLDP